MRKEVVFAIIAGVSIGLIIAFGAWKVTTAFKKSNVVENIKKNLPPQNNTAISISNLNDFDILTISPYVITGITKPKSDVVVSTTEADFHTIATEDGSFSIGVEFPAGLSEIKVNETASRGGEKLKVVYSSEFEKYLSDDNNVEPEKTDESTESGQNEIREKINKISLKKTAYVGTITDISSGTIQIKSVQGDIKQMSLSEDTSYVNTLKKNAEIKSVDLAIGDYIVAMGFVNGNKVLNAKGILISGPIVENKYEAISGTISQASKTKLVITKNNGEASEITLPKKWVGPNIKELKENQKIIVVGEINGDKFDLRTIFVVK